MADELIIDAGALKDAAVAESVLQDRSLEDMARASRSRIGTPPLRSPFFYYTFAGIVGALLSATAVYFVGLSVESVSERALRALTYVSGAAMIGLSMGMSYGLIYRNLRKALTCGIVGLLIAAGSAFFLAGVGELFATFAFDLPKRLMQATVTPGVEHVDKGLLLFLSMATRGFTWALVGLTMLLGPGVAMRSGPLIFSGVAAGSIGGFLGGASMPVFERLGPAWFDLSPVMSGLLGFAVLGLAIGMMMAVMEHGTREAWFILAKGPLRGKRFVLFKDTILVGSSMKCDLYLFNDPAIANVHASLSREGIRWLLRDEGAPQGTFVNGHRVQQCLLNHDDVVTLGETVLKFKFNMRSD